VDSPLVTLAAPLEVESLMAQALNLKREEMASQATGLEGAGMVDSPLATLAAPLEVESLMARALNLKREEMSQATTLERPQIVVTLASSEASREFALEDADSDAAARTTNSLNPTNPPSPTHGAD
jgi:hypothetical protein